MGNKIYIVMEGQYSDWRIIGYFMSKDNAERFCVLQDSKYDRPYVRVVDCLDGVIDLSDVEVLYEHEVVFDRRGGTMVMRNEPNRYRVYGGDNRANNIKVSPCSYEWICVKVNQREFNRKKAEKIAQDIMYEYLALACEFKDNDAEYAINYRLSAPQRAREEERKAAELREKEMTELARLKQKYEGQGERNDICWL